MLTLLVLLPHLAFGQTPLSGCVTDADCKSSRVCDAGSCRSLPAKHSVLSSTLLRLMVINEQLAVLEASKPSQALPVISLVLGCLGTLAGAGFSALPLSGRSAGVFMLGGSLLLPVGLGITFLSINSGRIHRADRELRKLTEERDALIGSSGAP